MFTVYSFVLPYNKEQCMTFYSPAVVVLLVAALHLLCTHHPGVHSTMSHPQIQSEHKTTLLIY